MFVSVLQSRALENETHLIRLLMALRKDPPVPKDTKLHDMSKDKI